MAFHCTSEICSRFRVEIGDPEVAENLYERCLYRWRQVLLWYRAREGCCGCGMSGFFGLRVGAVLEIVRTWGQAPGFRGSSQAWGKRGSSRWDGEPELLESVISPFQEWFSIWVGASFEEAGEGTPLAIFLLETLFDLCHGACVS